MAGVSASAITAGRAYVIISAIDKTKKTMNSVVANMNHAAGQMMGIGGRMAMGAGFASLGAALPVRQFAKFEDAMLAVRGKMGASTADYRRMTKLAQYYGATTSYTAQQVAEAMVVMAQMGLKADDIEASLGDILAAAYATGTELPAMADYILSSIRSFDGAFADAKRYADVFTAACNNSALSMEDLGYAMQYAGGSAKLAGMNIEETTTLLGALANLGLRGTMAGTSVRRMLEKMATPASREKLLKLGVNPIDAAGNFRPIYEVIRELSAAVEKLPEAEKIAILTDIFDVRGMTGVAKLTLKTFDDLGSAIENSGGAALNTMKIMDSGIGGTFRVIISAFEAFTNAIGQSFTGAINGARTGITNFLNSLMGWIQENQQAVIQTVILVTSVGMLGTTLFAAGLTLKLAAFSLSGFVGILTLLKVGIMAVVGTFTLLMGALSGVAALFASLGTVAGLFYLNAGLLVGILAKIAYDFFKVQDSGVRAWNALKDAGAELWGNLSSDARNAFGVIATLIAEGQWQKAFEVGISALRLLWSDFNLFFVKLWHESALAFSETWEKIRTKYQDFTEWSSNLIGWFMKLGMSREDAAAFDRELRAVQIYDRNKMERDLESAKKRHLAAIEKASRENQTARRRYYIESVDALASDPGTAVPAPAENPAPANIPLSESSPFQTQPIPAELVQNIIAGTAAASAVLAVAEFGTVAAERAFLENRAAVQNAKLEMERNAQNDENLARTANAAERIADRMDENEDNAIY